MLTGEGPAILSLAKLLWIGQKKSTGYRVTRCRGGQDAGTVFFEMVLY